MPPRLAILRVLLLAVLLAACPMARAQDAAAPPTDARVAAAVETMREKMAATRRAGQTPTQQDIGRFFDESMAGIDCSQLSLEQIQTLASARILSFGNASVDVMARLDELAKAEGEPGWKAMAIRLNYVLVAPDPADQTRVIGAAARHPGLFDGMRRGEAMPLLVVVRNVDAAVLAPALDDVLTAAENVPIDIHPLDASFLFMFYEGLAAAANENQKDRLERVRLRALDAVASAIVRLPNVPQPPNSKFAESLAAAKSKLESVGAAARLTKAPRLDFEWSSFPQPVRTLDDLKGKVVVLDFWATWCGPCVASFPDVRHLQERYKNYPVVIVGVTSLQGSHVNADKTRVDTKDDPLREYALMADYIAQQNITWRVAFSRQRVFNEDYGVRGIPHVVIIDANGNLRHRGLHPMSRITPFEEKCRYIDTLLAEAGLPVPPPPPAGG